MTAAPRADISLHFLGTGGVLFDAAARKVFAINTTATFIWCCLGDGETPAGVTQRLQRTLGLATAEAAAAVAAAVDAWQRLGLIGGPECAVAMAPTEAALRHSELATASGQVYRILDTAFCLRCSPARLARGIRPMLASLADRHGGGGTPVLRLDLALRDGRFVLAAGTEILSECRERNEIVPMLKGQINLLALKRSRDFAAIHAAAVSLGRRCVLLPAESGQGKSTLAGALAAAGLPLLGDDTIVLDEAALAARALPFGICVKAGAWRLLAGRYPSLSRRARHRRPDGKVVRYLLPRDGGAWAAPDFRQPVGWIVFPARRESGPADLHQLDKLEALARLLRGFYALGSGLDAARVDRLVAWLDGTPCLELRFSDLDAAVERLTKDLAC